MATILLIDDEPELVRFVRRALEADGHEVATAVDGAIGLGLALRDGPDLVVLDLLMPGVDGRAVLAALVAARPDIPVLVLSAEADVGARVEMLEAGAVDFMAKPFAVRELQVRVRRRLTPPVANDVSDAGAGQNVLRVRSAVLDLQKRSIQLDGRHISLSPREFLLLRHLMRRADSVCSREELLSEVWGYGFDPTTNVVDVCIARLRRKVADDLIDTVRNVGYVVQSG